MTEKLYQLTKAQYAYGNLTGKLNAIPCLGNPMANIAGTKSAIEYPKGTFIIIDTDTAKLNKLSTMQVTALWAGEMQLTENVRNQWDITKKILGPGAVRFNARAIKEVVKDETMKELTLAVEALNKLNQFRNDMPTTWALTRLLRGRDNTAVGQLLGSTSNSKLADLAEENMVNTDGMSAVKKVIVGISVGMGSATLIYLVLGTAGTWCIDKIAKCASTAIGKNQHIWDLDKVRGDLETVTAAFPVTMKVWNELVMQTILYPTCGYDFDEVWWQWWKKFDMCRDRGNWEGALPACTDTQFVNEYNDSLAQVKSTFVRKQNRDKGIVESPINKNESIIKSGNNRDGNEENL